MIILIDVIYILYHYNDKNIIFLFKMDIAINNLDITLVDSKKNLKLLLKRIKNDCGTMEGCILPKKINSNENLVCLIDKTNKDIVSFIWFGTYYNKIYFDSTETIYLHINYSFTFKKYRNIGLNKKLRLWLESFCNKNNIGYIVSVPLSESNSINILEKLGYIKINTYYLKKII